MKKISELWHSLTCGCHREHHKQLWSGWTRLVFPLMTAASVAWFLFRVIPNPARAAYPCQQAAFPLMSAFVIWLLGLKAGFVAWFVQRKIWLKKFRRRALIGAGSIALLILAGWVLHNLLLTNPPNRKVSEESFRLFQP